MTLQKLWFVGKLRRAEIFETMTSNSRCNEKFKYRVSLCSVPR